ncbi:hypothetical protein K8R42_01250 [bacterium]|nr:hypothetical protein [bacterium]
MFNYSPKIKALSVLIIIIVIIGVILLVRYNNSRSRDLELFSQAKILAIALERYYDKFYSYPESTVIDVTSIRMITDQGLNQEGNIIYFMQSFEWAAPASYTSNGTDYSIEFNLNNSWPVWNLEGRGGGLCRLTRNINIKCIEP